MVPENSNVAPEILKPVMESSVVPVLDTSSITEAISAVPVSVGSKVVPMAVSAFDRRASIEVPSTSR